MARSPHHSITLFPVSTTERNPSANIAELPVTADAANLLTAIMTFDSSDAIMTFRDFAMEMGPSADPVG